MSVVTFPPCPECCCPMTSIEDGFSGSNGDPIVGRLPDTHDVGTLWAVTNGTWTIQGGKCQAITNNGGGAHYKAFAESYVSGTAAHPVTITFDVTIPLGTGSISPGACFRFADDNNHWLLTPDVTNGDLYLEEVSGGVGTVRGLTSISLTPGSTYTVTIVLNDTSISATYDGTNLSVISAANLTNTMHGLDDFFDQVNSFGTLPKFEDFKVVCA